MITGDYRYKLFARDFFTCQACGATNRGQLTLAHRIKSGSGSEQYIKAFIRLNYKIEASKRMIDSIIDHEYNLTTACAGRCNSLFNIFFDPMARDMLLHTIIKNIIGARNGNQRSA